MPEVSEEEPTARVIHSVADAHSRSTSRIGDSPEWRLSLG